MTSTARTTPTGTITQLPDTSFGILGLLTFGQELSGYDMVKAVEGSLGFFWAPAKSQIYTELKRLRAAGLITEREVAQDNRPDKRVYTITPTGVEAFQAWLRAADDEPEEVKSVFLLKLFYGHRMEGTEVRAKLLEFRAWAEASLAQYEAIEAIIDEHGGPDAPNQLYPYLTLTYGLAHARAGIAWADDVLARLDAGAATGTRKKKGGKR
jgi:DNA-binding PadR family transcriptional regulator